MRMTAISSVAQAKDAFPDLLWRDKPSDNGKGALAFVICDLDRTSGDNTIFLAMEGGASAYSHVHLMRLGWPFGETIVCLAGEVYGVKYFDPDFVLRAGACVDLLGDEAHAPYVLEDGFALLVYRQPGGHRRGES